MARKPADHPFLTAGAERITLDAPTLEGFVETFLLDTYDNSHATPQFHRDLWSLFTSRVKKVVISAPRGHGKTTAGTHAYALAAVLFGQVDYVLLVGATEGMAAQLLSNIKVELTENKDLIDAFTIQTVVSNETEFVGRVRGREFCIVVRGAYQKVRGLLWRQKRPELILVDDLEEDEAVESADRRDKLSKWFANALMQCGGDRTIFRVVGTILHLDSQLQRLLRDDTWTARKFAAHADFDDFSQILWPEKFPEERLQEIRQSYVNQGNASGYSQEYLSNPIAVADAYFRKEDFLPMRPEDFASNKTYYIGVDMALSLKKRADYTAFVVAGMDPMGILHFVDCICARMDSIEIINKMFQLYAQYKPVAFILGKDHISGALGPVLYSEMRARGAYFELDTTSVRSNADKRTQAQSIKARLRSQGCRFDKEASWFAPYQQELLSFDKGVHDDRVDATANIGLHLNRMVEPVTLREEEEEEIASNEYYQGGGQNRSSVTGY